MSFQKFTTFHEMERWLDENRVTEIECLVPDLTGVARGKILPRNKFSEEKGMRLPEAIFGATVTGEYPDSDMFNSIIAPTDQDMELRPDPTTVRETEPVAAPTRTSPEPAMLTLRSRVAPP